MADFKFLAIPAEDYDALGIDGDTVLQTYFDEQGRYIIQPTTPDDTEDFACNGDCEACPVAETECDHDCQACPCYVLCVDSDWRKEIE
jgi:hypothetical protein